MKSLDLFSGIGGLTVALHPFGITPVMYCDIEQSSRDSLTRLMKSKKIPQAPIHDDIRTLKHPPKADIVCAGFPCLGFSPLGAREGLRNEQSNLVYDVIRLSRQCGASIVFLENHVSLVQDRYTSDFNAILKSFRASGFIHVRYVMMHGHDVGCPQTRRRVYVMLTKKIHPKTVPYSPGKSFSWKTMPCPMSHDPVELRRVKLLGNSVIPDLTRAAFLLLWTGCQRTDISKKATRLPFAQSINAPPSSTGDVGMIVRGTRQTFTKPEIVTGFSKKIPTITIDPRLYPRPAQHKATSPLVLQPTTRLGFMTLTTHQTSGCHVLTQRSSKHLVSILRFIKQTPKHLRNGNPNIHFYEWLMGYPKNWTR